MIKANNITFTYGSGKEAVKNLSFEIKPGEIMAFVGKNGAGKTTVIKMLTGILTPKAGEVVINGHNMLTDSMAAKRSLSYVADNPDIFLQLKGIEYINFIADIYEVPKNLRTERIEELATRFDIKSALNSPMREYSHGMRQKLMVCTALVHNPPAWILDEPMTGLDPQAAYELKKMMIEHAKKGNSVLFSTHVLEVAEKLCDKILIINHGEEIYAGTLDELKQNKQSEDLEDIFIKMVQ